MPPETNKPDIKIHPLAEAMPPMTEDEFAELKKSIEENGQRDRAILLDGKVLDGRNRACACAELGIPLKFRPYDKKRDGLIPEALVVDKNITRRQLKPSQKAAIAAELSEKILEARKQLQEEGKSVTGEKGKADDIAGDITGASGRATSDARKLKQDDPEAFKEVKEGKSTVNEAKSKVAKKKAREDGYRQEVADALEAHHETAFIDAIRDGIILKKKPELKYFLALPVSKQTAISSMVAKGWTPEKAVNQLDDATTAETTVGELVNRALATEDKNHYADNYAGWEITLVKIDDE